MGISLDNILGDDSSFSNMSPKEREYFAELLKEEMKRRDSASNPIQVKEIVPIEKWVNSEYYVGSDVNNIYPFWKDVIIDIFREDRKPEEQINQVILSGAIGIGKSCLDENTRIPTSVGLLPLKELYDLYYNKGVRFKVQSESVWKDCIDVFDNGISDTKTIVMASGREVRCTYNHKFRVLRNGIIEWVKSEDLVAGDKSVMTRKETPFGDAHMSQDEAYKLGWECRVKNIPSDIFKCDKATVSSFIRGVMDKESITDSDKSLLILSESEVFIRDLASLLSMFGINYHLSKMLCMDCNGLIDVYRLRIADNESHLLYQKHIGFDVWYKKQRLGEYCDSLPIKLEQVSNIFYDEVVDIQEGGKVHTMDLTIDTDHSYCFDGFISHNTIAELIMLRKLYEMSCWKNINARYQLMSKTNIMFLYFSVNKVQAERTGFGEIRSWVDNSPYFRDEFPRQGRIKEALIFPEGLTFVYGSGSQHSIGMSVIGTIMDEANFMGANGNGDVEKASELYAGIVNRANSRFIIDGGINHSLNILISSSTHESSVTERQIQASKNDKHTYVCAPAQWEVKPQKFSKKFFYVCKGTNYLEPYIVNSTDDVNNFRMSEGLKKKDYVDGIEDFDKIDSMVKELPPHQQTKFLAVPVDLRRGFETNIMKSLQDLGGVSVSSQGKLFTSVSVYNSCVSEKFRHPFIQPSIIISTGDKIEIKDYLRSDFRLRHPDRPRFIHIDQSYRTDDTGISMVYVDEILEEDGVKKPIYGVDFMIQINPPKPPKKIAIYKIRNFVVWLANVFNVKIGKVTYDIFNSEESRQILEEMGFNVAYQSVDRTDKAYLDTVEIMYEGRLRMYDYSIFRSEIFNVVHYRDRHKVDHLKTNSDGSVGKKDVADSLCGAIENALSFKIEESATTSHIEDFMYVNSISQQFEDVSHVSVEQLIERQIDAMIDDMEDGTGTILW